MPEYVQLVNGGTKTIEEAREMFDVGEIVERVGDWAVTPYGLASLVTYYPVEKERLGELDLVYTMEGKNWVKIAEFIKAVEAARRYHEVPSPFALAADEAMVTIPQRQLQRLLKAAQAIYRGKDSRESQEHQTGSHSAAEILENAEKVPLTDQINLHGAYLTLVATNPHLADLLDD